MSSRTIKAGLIPFYLELYDRARPELREAFAPFLDNVRAGLESRGVEVVQTDVCRVKSEFAAAKERLDREDVDLAITLHLAYSPSLESADVFASFDKPLLILDTTMDARFGPEVDPERLMYNHGIHGVQDFANLLRRMGKDFFIVAGHIKESDVLDRAASIAKGVAAARQLRSGRVLRIGETFTGMGDFAVGDQRLTECLGVRVDQKDLGALRAEAARLSDADIDQEMQADRERFDVAVDEAVHRRSAAAGLALRRVLDEGGYTGFSMNFLAFDSPEEPVSTVPFVEAGHAMARGLGYAGEGDVLTASLLGAVNGAFGETTFTEIFCPDWTGNRLFLSHMGEINPAVAAGKPRLVLKDFPWTDALEPAAIACAPRPGAAVLFCWAPATKGLELVAAPVEVLGDGEHPDMQNLVRGWIRPRALEVGPFLERLSEAGGIHHCGMVCADELEGLRAFARCSGIPLTVIE